MEGSHRFLICAGPPVNAVLGPRLRGDDNRSIVAILIVIPRDIVTARFIIILRSSSPRAASSPRKSGDPGI
jgi:hypothetical protein